mgnify:CR=1 FL=1
MCNHVMSIKKSRNHIPGIQNHVVATGYLKSRNHVMGIQSPVNYF